MTLKSIFTWLAALGGIVAAGLWYKASVVEFVPDPTKPGPSVQFLNGDHRWDPIRTAELQTKWNKRAALAAAIAAALQALTLAMPG